MRRMLVLLPLIALAVAALLLLGEAGRDPDAGVAVAPIAGPPAADVPWREEPGSPVVLRGHPEASVGGTDSGDLPRAAQAARAVARVPGLPRATYKGRVVDADGVPIRGASAYQLRGYEVRGGHRAHVPHAATDAEGRFSLLGYVSEDSVFGASAPGYVTAFLAGDAVDPGEDVQFVLEEAPRLCVRLVDAEGEPVAFARVRVVPTERRGRATLYPGPDAPVRALFDMTNADGAVEFRLDRRVPVMVIPEIEDRLVVPAEQWLPEPEGELEFTVRKGTFFAVRALDEHGAPVHGPVWVEVHDSETGQERVSFRSAGHDAVADWDLPLASGSYVVEVTVEGREPALLPNVVIPDDGSSVEEEVRMGPLGAAGTLRIHLEVAQEGAKDKRRRGILAPRLIMRRLDGGWARMGWRPHPDFQWDGVNGVAEVSLRPGLYDALICLPTDRRVALLERVSIGSGQRLTRRPPARVGVVARLYAVLPPDVEVRKAYFESPRLGILPCVGRHMLSSLEDVGGLVDSIAPAGSGAREHASSGPWIGPYPGPAITLVVEDWRGVTRRYVVRGD